MVNNKVDQDDFTPMLAVAITYWILWIISVSSLTLSVKNNSTGTMKISVFCLYLRSLISIFDIEKSRKYIYESPIDIALVTVLLALTLF